MMASGGFPLPRTNLFPAGLRVLVVDDDPTWLKILEKMLNKCNYQVTTCNLAREALKLLRERKDRFDIVISDVNMPDMDGFKLLEHVGLEMDLPVIMMSVDGETSRVMKGVQHGACDYLLKPIRMKELRNIWQHVFRKRAHEVSLEDLQRMRSRAEQSDVFSGDPVSGKKRRDVDDKHGDRVCSDPFSAKRARVVWTVDLHQKFVKAVNQIGFDKVGPKKILNLMGVPWLTRENVASHLQKYRLYLSRLQKEDEVESAFGGMTQTDTPATEPYDNACLQNTLAHSTTAMRPTIPASANYAVSCHKIPICNDEPKNSARNMTPVPSNLTTAHEKGLTSGLGVPAEGYSRLSSNHCFGVPDSDVKCEPMIQVQYSWSAEGNSGFNSEQTFDGLHLTRHQIFGTVDPSLVPVPGTARDEADKPARAAITPSYGKNRSESMDKGSKAVDSAATLFSVQPESHWTDRQMIDPLPCSPWNTQNHILEQDLFENLEYSNITGAGTALTLWDEDFSDHSSQGDFFPPNAYLGDVESPDYTNKELIADVAPHLYDSLKLDSDDPTGQMEYPVVDQNQFIP